MATVPVIGQSGADTGSGTATSLPVPLPAGAAAGHVAYLVQNINAGSGITKTDPAGWGSPLVGPVVNSFSNNQLIVWKKVLTSADITAGSVSVTASSARGIQAGIVVVAGIHESVSGAQTDNTVATGNIQSVTPAVADCLLLAIQTAAADASNSARTFNPPSGWTELVDDWGTSTANPRGGVWIAAKQLSGGAGTPTSGTDAWTITGGNVRGQGVVIVVEPTAVSFTGSGSLSGSGTLTATGAPNASGAAALSGSGTLTGAGTPRPAAAAVLSGSGTLTATGAPAVPGTAALSGSGSLTATATPSVPSTAALSGSGTLTATGSPPTAGTAALSGSGTLVATAKPALPGTAVLSGVGTLVAIGLPALARAAALSGNGTLTALGATGSSGSCYVVIAGVRKAATTYVIIGGVRKSTTRSVILAGTKHPA